MSKLCFLLLVWVFCVGWSFAETPIEKNPQEEAKQYVKDYMRLTNSSAEKACKQVPDNLYTFNSCVAEAANFKNPLEVYKEKVFLYRRDVAHQQTSFNALSKNTKDIINKLIDYSQKYMTKCDNSIYYIDNDSSWHNSYIIELKNLKSQLVLVKPYDLTEADKMNGYSWKGIITFKSEGGIARTHENGKPSDWEGNNPNRGYIIFPSQIKNGELSFWSSDQVYGATLDYKCEVVLNAPLQCKQPMKADINYRSCSPVNN